MADSFFGSHDLAEYFASINRSFLTLSKRNKKEEALTDVKQRLAKGQVARGVIKAHGYELVVYKNPNWAQTPPPSPFPNELLVWGVGSPIPRRATVEPGSCMLPRVLTGGGWCQPTGRPTPHHDTTNDVGLHSPRLHLAVRGRQRLCGMQGSWSRGTRNHRRRTHGTLFVFVFAWWGCVLGGREVVGPRPHNWVSGLRGGPTGFAPVPWVGMAKAWPQ